MGEQFRSGELRKFAERDHQLAGEAIDAAGRERSAAAGNPDHPHPDIAAADRVRARDDVRTYGRQADLAERSADVAETLDASAGQLDANRRRIEQVGDEARARSGEVDDLARDVRDLREQTHDAAGQVRDIDPPDVDR